MRQAVPCCTYVVDETLHSLHVSRWWKARCLPVAYCTMRSHEDHSEMLQYIVLRSAATSLNCSEHVSAELGQVTTRWYDVEVSPTTILMLWRTLQIIQSPQNRAQELSQSMSAIHTSTSLLQSPCPPRTMVAPIIISLCAVFAALLSLDGCGPSMEVRHHSSGPRTRVPPTRERVQCWQHHHRTRSHLYILKT